MKIDLYPKKAQFKRGEPVSLQADIADCSMETKAMLCIYHLADRIAEIPVLLQNGANTYMAGPYTCKMGGFGVQLEMDTGSILASTAFDVQNRTDRSIRYGFLSDFDTKDGVSDADLDFMLKFHMNMVQFYDWSWRHDSLVSRNEIYEDMMGKRKDLSVIRRKIGEAHKRGMKALAYGAVYASSEEYRRQHKEQGLYALEGVPFRFIDKFCIMNISEGNGWRDHILEEYKTAVTNCGFDGIHMDTYGFPKTALDASGRCVRLEEAFPGLILDAKKRLEECGRENFLIFNHVGNWPVGETARTPQAAVYIEVWPPYEHYYHIREIIREARQAWQNRKPVILAAYLAPFRLESRERAENAALLLTAALTSLGASHLWLGEEGCALTQGYYPDYTPLSPAFLNRLRRYYDFNIRYMELFMDPELTEVSMTHMGGDNYEYQCSFSVSGDGRPDTVWTVIRQSRRCKCISLINLNGCDDLWNAGKETPHVQEKLAMEVLSEHSGETVWYASPDSDDISLKKLPHTVMETERGRFLCFEVERLQYWDIIWIDSSSAADQVLQPGL